MKILVVDDEFLTAGLIADRLRSFGYSEIEEVLCAGSGGEALDILEREPCDILITDICMSPIDGLELVSRAKELYPGLTCILLSAFDEFTYAQQGIRLGVRDYWLKPFNTEHMKRSLREIITEIQSTQSVSRTILDAFINEAVTSGTKTMDEIFTNTPSYPGHGAYVAVWDSVISRRISLPDFWIYQPQNGKSLFACPLTRGAPEAEMHPSSLKEQLRVPIGVSMLSGTVSEAYWQARYALSLTWVYNDEPELAVLQFRETDTGLLDKEVRGLAELMDSMSAASPEAVLERLEEKREAAEPFVFAVCIDRLCRQLEDRILRLSGEESLYGTGDGIGWKRRISRLIRQLASVKYSSHRGPKRDPIMQSIDYIEKHYSDSDLNMTAVAESMGLSYQYFSELFHLQTGRLFSEYLMDYRMKEACRLLLRGIRVSEVAERVGYQYPHSFVRAFKKLYGVSPNVFRSMNQ